LKLYSYKAFSLLETTHDNITIGISINTIQKQENINIPINNVYDFIKSYGITLNIISPETSTDIISWLDNIGIKYDGVVFVDKSKIWNNVDILIEDDPYIINSKPLSKVCIKVTTPSNENILNDINIPNIAGLTISIVKSAISNFDKKHIF
jgi:hypothetical protein